MNKLSGFGSLGSKSKVVSGSTKGTAGKIGVAKGNTVKKGVSFKSGTKYATPPTKC